MNLKRIGRLLVCLVLVVCLIVNISPIRAKASATATAVIVGMSAVTVACTLMLGCGVLPGSDVNIFTDVANTLASNLESSGWVTDGMIDVYKLNDAAYTWGVPQGVVELVKNLLWDNEVISSDAPALEYADSSYDRVIATCMEHPYYFFARRIDPSTHEISAFLCGYADDPISTYLHNFGYGTYNIVQSASLSVYTKNYGWSGYASQGPFTDVSIHSAGDVIDGISSPLDLTLGEVAPESSSFTDGYSTWAGNATTIPGTAGDGSDDIVVVPAGNLFLDDVTTQSQEDIWNGALVEDDETEDIPAVPPVEGLTGSLSDTNAGTFLDSIFAFFTALFAPATEFFDNFWAFADYLIECLEITLADKIEAVTTAVTSIPAAFSSWLEQILEWLSKLWDLIASLPGAFVDVITEALVWAFVPSEAYLDAEVTALCSEFPLADSCKNLITAFRDSLSGLGGEPPVIYIHLEDYEGSYNIGGTVPILDMRWYARYKPTVDTLLSSLLWIFFIWRVLVHAPSIISGVAGDVEAFNSGPSGGYFSADNPYRGQFERPARGRFESRRNRK